MELNYRYAESTKKPPVLEVSGCVVYLRKDFSKINKTPEYSAVYWAYQEVVLSLGEFNEYISLLMAENAINGEKDSNNIANMMISQKNNDNNHLAIMEAIADLYEMLLSI